MSDIPVVFPTDPTWESPGSGRIPFWVYTDEAIYKRELERFFYHGHWCYVALEAELPNPGDFKTTMIGERSVVVTRDRDGCIHAVENVCAHRGMQFCRERYGNKKELVCPYHQWSYALNGDLQGVPFRRGVKQDGKVLGGMPRDFKTEENGLNKLKVAIRGGVIFASFDHDVESFEDYLGPEVLVSFDRLFNGRKLKILGYNRQRVPGNWKLMQENIKDPYHAGLLHTWFVNFGLWRADNKSQVMMDARFRHGVMSSTRSEDKASAEVTAGISSFRQSMEINDKRLLDVENESWWNGPTVVMITIFPNIVFQQQVNSVSTRAIRPNGVGSFDFEWTHFGFEDDTPEMTERRLMQANLFGPAGFVSAEDGEVIEMSQHGFEQKPFYRTVTELDGQGFGNVGHTVTEGLIRGMYDYWRKVMEV